MSWLNRRRTELTSPDFPEVLETESVEIVSPPFYMWTVISNQYAGKNEKHEVKATHYTMDLSFVNFYDGASKNPVFAIRQSSVLQIIRDEYSLAELVDLDELVPANSE